MFFFIFKYKDKTSTTKYNNKNRKRERKRESIRKVSLILKKNSFVFLLLAFKLQFFKS
jgi:hypothetical protein